MGFHRIALAFTLVSATAHAREVPVSTPAALMTAISSAVPGDEIILAEGTYALAGATCSAVGTMAAPIIVRSATPMGAKIEFNGLEGFKVTGAHWQFSGLDIKGVCPDDNNCEHAFHVMGAAHYFVLKNSKVTDFNAQLKVNASMIGTGWITPNNGLVEGNDIGDTRKRMTANPTTKLNIDTGEDWVVRRNKIHDAEKGLGDYVSYMAFMKSGGKRGIFEQNLVICAAGGINEPGYRIGLSFGGGGTAPQFCAPAFNANTPCNVEHDGGIIRNNIIINCSDVGVYLNRSANSHILYNTLIETSGIDFRFNTTTGEARGNLMANVIRQRDGAVSMESDNLENTILGVFQMMYRMPLTGDLTATGSIGMLSGGAANPLVTDDYCGRARPAGALTKGALEHSLGDCNTVNPTSDAGVGGDAGVDDGSDDWNGCICRAGGGNPAHVLPLAIVTIVLGLRRRRR